MSLPQVELQRGHVTKLFRTLITFQLITEELLVGIVINADSPLLLQLVEDDLRIEKECCCEGVPMLLGLQIRRVEFLRNDVHV